MKSKSKLLASAFQQQVIEKMKNFSKTGATARNTRVAIPLLVTQEIYLG
jgi:hypothetical protein